MQKRNLKFIQLLTFLLLALSFSSYAKINLSIHLKDNLDSSNVTVSGFEILPLNDHVAKVFGIPRQVVGDGHHQEIWKIINKWWGRIPDEFITSDPVLNSSFDSAPRNWTPYADSWGEENQVRVEKKAVGVTLVDSIGSVENLVSKNIKNLSKCKKVEQEIELTYFAPLKYSRYSKNSWAMSLNNGIEININGEYAGFSVEAKNIIEFIVENENNSDRRSSHLFSKEIPVTLKASVNTDLETIYPVSLIAAKGSLRVKIDYEYKLTGNWRAIYIQKSYKGSLASPLSDIEKLLKKLNRPLVIRDSEILEVDFVTDGKINIGEGMALNQEKRQSIANERNLIECN